MSAAVTTITISPGRVLVTRRWVVGVAAQAADGDESLVLRLDHKPEPDKMNYWSPRPPLIKKRGEAGQGGAVIEKDFRESD
ncbi:hypothetical protein E2C01_095151 [Portunus trituberculatus]|uniref:Uncharacterized protein n=1 Tax=Portunus trituberculatus TaxID=210409 RepID=A0A5B7JP36_PORTR|nr:hypothetical protein [Portunus trituberculatus]